MSDFLESRYTDSVDEFRRSNRDQFWRELTRELINKAVQVSNSVGFNWSSGV